MYRRLTLILSLLIALSLACNLPGGGQTAPPGGPPSIKVSTATTVVQPKQSDENQPTPTEIPTLSVPTETPVPAEPVPIRQGLASLDSYVLKYTTNSYGPNPQDQSLLTVEMSYSKEDEATYTHTQSTSSSAEDTEVNTSETYQYVIGEESCSGSGDDWTYDTVAPLEKEMTDLLGQTVDLVLLIDDPLLVGRETLNGIETHHFTFQVSGLGVESGSEVISNQGEYWLAVDGQYLVKYSLEVQLRDTQGEDVRLEVYLELSQVNQPLEISFPQACLEAKNAP